MKSCCFIGHRKIDQTEELKEKIFEYLENLITKNNVTNFLFGSKSEFNTLCHETVTKLKEKYPNIKRIAYTCKNELAPLETERDNWERLYNQIKSREKIQFFEEEFNHKNKTFAGKSSYIQRNFAMIEDSDFCIFYYNENFLPPKKEQSKTQVSSQPKSGTALAFSHAKQKKKEIKNFFTK